MAKNEITGTILIIRNTEKITDNFRKREFVIYDESNLKFPQYILMQFIQDKCDKLNFFKVNDPVIVTYSLKGRRVVKNNEEKFFLIAEAWDIAHKA